MSYAKIELVVVLWEHVGYGGRRVVLTEDAPDLRAYGFNDTASAIGIHPGPNFDPQKRYVVSFYEHPNFQGGQLVLGPGGYASLEVPHAMNDRISSVKFGQDIALPHTIATVPLVVELYEHAGYAGQKRIILQDEPSLQANEGFARIVSSVKIFRGPSYTAGWRVRFYRGINWTDQDILLDPGDYPNLAALAPYFNDAIQSLRFGQFSDRPPYQGTPGYTPIIYPPPS